MECTVGRRYISFYLIRGLKGALMETLAKILENESM